MKICFWGSSHGVPEKNRKCTTIMVEVQSNRYFFDMGSSVIEQLINESISFNSIKGVFITHMHGDHTFGLPSFIDLSDWFFKNYSTKIFLPRESAKTAICQWILENRVGTNGWIEELNADISSYKSGEIFNDGIIKVTATKNFHIDDSYSFLIEHDGKRIIYTGDLRNPSIDFPIEFSNEKVDLLICEGAHFPLCDYSDIVNKLPIKEILVTHYTEKCAAEFDGFEKMVRANSQLVTDGLEFIL